MKISKCGLGLAVTLVAFASAAAIFGSRYAARHAPSFAPKAVAAAAQVRVNGSQPRMPLAHLRLSGQVIELAPGAPLTVTATVGGSTFPATVSGNTYTVSIGRPAAGQMITLDARSTRVHYRAAIGSAGRARTQAGSDSHLTLSEQPSLRISPYGTALQWLVRYALGNRDANSDAEFEKMMRVAASSDLEYAAYSMAIFARGEPITEPFNAYADGYELVRDRAAFGQFIAYGAREASTGYLYAQAHEQALSSLEGLPDPLVLLSGGPREQVPFVGLYANVYLLSRRGDGRFDFNERWPLSNVANSLSFNGQGRVQLAPVGTQVRVIGKMVDVGGGHMVQFDFDRSAAGRTLKRLTKGDSTSLWILRSVWHDQDKRNPAAPMVEEIEYQVLSSTALESGTLPNGWASVANSTVALPWMCGAYPSQEEQIYDFSQCEYVEHKFNAGGTGSTVDHGWKVHPQTMEPKQPRSQPFTWALAGPGALDITDGNVATTFWRLKDYPADIGPVFFRSRSIAGVWGGKTMVGVSMAATKRMTSWPAASAIGNWRIPEPEYLSTWYTGENYSTVVQRNSGGTGQQTIASGSPTHFWWQAVGSAVYDKRVFVWYYGYPANPPYTVTCEAGIADGGTGCNTRVRYFKPIARVGDRYYGIGNIYVRYFYPEDVEHGYPEESWNQHLLSELVYYDCTGGACLTAATPAAQGPRVAPSAGRRDQPAVRAATPPRGQRIPGRHN